MNCFVAQAAEPTSIRHIPTEAWLNLPPVPPLQTAPTLILTAFTETEAQIKAFESFLLPEDRPRIDHMKNERGRLHQIQTRAILRILLNQLLGRRDWVFRPDKHEKPILFLPDGSTPLHINLSHSRRQLFIGIHPTHPIGVDIETPERDVKWEGVSRLVYTEQERQWIFADAGIHLRERFFRAWTCKEAVMKSEGAGFLKSPQRISIHFEPTNATPDLPKVHYCDIDNTPLAWCVL